jgi:Mg-chelatase subunit ChlD
VTLTATPTPIYTIYLPMVLRIPCQERAVDVALVVDVSSSMRRPAGDGGTKLDAVLRAARAFVEHFQPTEGRGRVAVVAFNNQAWLLQPLTSDRARLDAALAGLPRLMAEGTRLDLGLAAGAAALAAVPPPRLRAMVFLTDGLPNRVPTPMAGGTQEDTVLVAAAAARAAGIRIQTVGYGREDAPELVDRILPWLLRAIAGDTGGYRETDDASALAEVFRSLAAELGCVKEVQWP